jgi:hypothetical protein
MRNFSGDRRRCRDLSPVSGLAYTARRPRGALPRPSVVDF